MNWRNWSDLSRLERVIALHEAAHAVLGEVLGWRVKRLVMNRRQGVCRFQASEPAPWINVVVSAAGHAVERHRYGRVIGSGSQTDRESVYAALEVAGVDISDGILAADDIEADLWPVFEHAAVERAVTATAHVLAEGRYLVRSEFLSLAAPALQHPTRRRVRRFCARLARDIHAKNFTREGYE